MLLSVIKRLSFSIVTVTLIQNLAICQSRRPNFFEVIEGDSVMLFFDHNYSFTEKRCGEYTRFSRANEKGDFKGKFIDVSHANDLLGTGTYNQGKKNGYFEIFYPSGKLKCHGMYLNDIPVGQWKFFYDNGLPERTIEFVGDEIVLLQSVDKKGNLNVVNGNGVFKGIVMDGKVNLMAKGKVVNGRPTGKWISWYPSQGWRYRFSNEVYKDGKFVKGNVLKSFQYRQINSIPFGGRRDTTARKAMRRVAENFKTYRQCLNNFFLDNYLIGLERFRFHRCDSLLLGNQEFILNIQSFRNELTDRVAEAFATDPKYIARGYDQGSVAYLTLRFSVNAERLPKNFEGASFLGNEFDSSIISAISRLTIFSPERELYFRMKIVFSTPTQYHFSYRFTRDRLKTW